MAKMNLSEQNVQDVSLRK